MKNFSLFTALVFLIAGCGQPSEEAASSAEAAPPGVVKLEDDLDRDLLACGVAGAVDDTDSAARDLLLELVGAELAHLSAPAG